MALKAKAPIVVLVVLILFSLFLTNSIYNLLKKERAENISLKADINDLQTKKQVIEAKLAKAEESLVSLEAVLKDANQQVSTLETALEKEKSDKAKAVADMDKLKVDMEAYKSAKTDLETKLSTAKDNINSMQAQLKSLDEQKKTLESKVAELETKLGGVELGKIVVGAPEPAGVGTTQAAAGVSIEGKILVVNKDYNFVVINLGVKDGINAGDVFSVYRQEAYIGDVKVEKVHDAMSAAGFVSPEMKDKVNEGDRVVKKT